MKRKLLYIIIGITLFGSCKQASEFYNPDATVSVKYKMPTDTIYYNKENEIFSDIRHLSNIDNYLIITQKSKDTLFQVLNMKNDSVVAGFGRVGHARNEFIATPRAVYCGRDKNGSPLLYVLDGLCTKTIDIEKSVEANECILTNIIKENVDRYFYNVYHIGDNSMFVYKRVSYKDARDAVYIAPQSYMMNGKTKFEWNIYPNIIAPEWTNMVDAAYSSDIWIKPNGSKAISVSNFIDIVNIFDFSTKKMLGVINPDCYTYDFIEQEGSESTIKEHLRYFNTSACVNDDCFIILKDGNLYKDIIGENDENRCSFIHLYDWNGQLQAAYMLDQNIIYIAYYDKKKRLYAVSSENKLYRYTLK